MQGASKIRCNRSTAKKELKAMVVFLLTVQFLKNNAVPFADNIFFIMLVPFCLCLEF
jgi:hypothetical protein